jgi:NADH:ubiquinone reductase (H+-translocating)
LPDSDTSEKRQTDKRWSKPRPSVVIVGAGFGGLEAARALAKANADVIIVDKKNHHCFQPLLYQTATAALSPADIAWPVRSILSGQQNTTVFMAEVNGVDLKTRVVMTSEGLQLPFDYLIIATGVTTSYFSHPEWAAHAPGLKTIEDATAIRGRILSCFERAERLQGGASRRNSMRFVVVGGGPTGVELAGSISDIVNHVLVSDFRHIDPSSAEIILVEAGNRLLTSFAPKHSDYARTTLERMGVHVITGLSVTDCTSDAVTLSDGRILDCCCTIWAAGVRGTSAAKWLTAQADRSDRIVVDEFLRIPPHQDVFAIGDIAAAHSDGKRVPGLAPAAKQMGRFVGKMIASEIGGRSRRRKSFHYDHQGDLAAIGRKSAVVSLKHLQLRGRLGWLFWSVVHIYFLIGLRSRVAVAANWAWEYLTFQRGARLIS